MLTGDISFGYKPNKKQLLSLEQFTPYYDANDEPLADFLSPTEATIELGVNINAIYDFIKLGYLECEKQQVKRDLLKWSLKSLLKILNLNIDYLGN